jgi:hypothetical protein
VKQHLQTYEGRPFERLQENVHQILRSIEPDELETTMRAWIKSLRRVIALGGE